MLILEMYKLWLVQVFSTLWKKIHVSFVIDFVYHVQVHSPSTCQRVYMLTYLFLYFRFSERVYMLYHTCFCISGSQRVYMLTYLFLYFQVLRGFTCYIILVSVFQVLREVHMLYHTCFCISGSQRVYMLTYLFLYFRFSEGLHVISYLFL